MDAFELSGRRSTKMAITCSRCLNSSANPSVRIEESGPCQVCVAFDTLFSEDLLHAEQVALLGLRGANGSKPDCLVGLSGGKDSTAALVTLVEMGFQPHAFTVDLGYYPEHTFERAANLSETFDVPYIRFDARSLIRDVDRLSYRLTADLYDGERSAGRESRFRETYLRNRAHYSAKCSHPMAFVRTCQLCRRTVIRAYAEVSRVTGIPTVVLGMNEWTGLSQLSAGRQDSLSAFRLLRGKDGWPLRIVHLPFLLRRTLSDTVAVLTRIGWKPPMDEQLVESNVNSCLFAYAAETVAAARLGFHPDTSRLSREITAGFLPRCVAQNALSRPHDTLRSVREVLEDAGVF